MKPIIALSLLLLITNWAGAAEERTYQTKNYASPRTPSLPIKNFTRREHASVPTPVGGLPTSFDWRQKGTLSPITDQGACGDVWAFVPVELLENALWLFGKQPVRLSIDEVNYCTPNSNGCGGGDPGDAFDYLVHPGVSLASDIPPYKNQSDFCKNLPDEFHFTSWAALGTQNTEPTNDEIKAAIYQYGLVAAGIDAASGFENYSAGIYNNCKVEGQESVDHLVSLVGWNDDGGYWIGRNTWGADWGENGYFRIKYGCNAIGSIAAYGVYSSK